MAELTDLRARIGAQSGSISAAEYARLARAIGAAQPAAGERQLRVAILGSCTLNFVDPFLAVEGLRQRMQLRTFYGAFGQFEQQIRDIDSKLYAFGPEVLVIVMRPEDLDPDAFHRFHSKLHTGRSFTHVIDRIAECVGAFRDRSAAPVLVANFAHPAGLPLGPFDANVDASLTYAIAEANRALRAVLARIAGAAVWDYAGLVRSSGAERWCDPRMWAIARVPVAADRQPILARHLARSLAGVTRPPAKCLVLDLDHTLWGGVIGDDGLNGIQLGDDYPGSVYKSFQRAALGLADRGILLAIASKNYPEIVDRALREHADMLIRHEHLSAMRVNWNPKSDNLREIAIELNIGLDALVHFDDNPMERAEIAANAPAVNIIDVPADPLRFEEALRDCGFFDAVTLSAEDRQRVHMYRDARARDEVRASAHSVEDFLTGLEMVAQVGPVDESSIGRVSQLVEKTNQFNLTTRRHSRAEIGRMVADPEYALIDMRLQDRFGDLGLIAVGILAFRGGDAVVDTLLMSCRAMGRRAEVALIAELIRTAKLRGCERFVGEYIPTARNGIVAELFTSLGFETATLDGSGGRFVLDLSARTVEWPAALQRIEKPTEISL
jgi:FkbH-like protein